MREENPNTTRTVVRHGVHPFVQRRVKRHLLLRLQAKGRLGLLYGVLA
jgi:hypothetical protein